VHGSSINEGIRDAWASNWSMMESMERADGIAADRLFVDEATFRAWYDGALPRVYGYLLRRVGDSSSQRN